MTLWLFAVKTLFADRGKLITALVGVIFSVVLVNVQGGLFIGLIRKASLLVDNGRADIWAGHKKMHSVDFPRDIPRSWVHRIRAVPGVAAAEPYTLGLVYMTLPDGGFEGVIVIGVERSSLLGNAWNLKQGSAASIFQVDGIVVDQSEGPKLGHPQFGELREVGGRRARVVAKTHGVTSFLITPYIFTTYERAAAFLGRSLNRSSYFLVRLTPGSDPQQVCEEIRRRVPELDVFTRDEFSRITINFWMTRTGLGISFGAATLIGLCVGLVMVAQSLYALVLGRLTEYGTLKAIGANERQIFGLLCAQATVIAMMGSVLGLVLVIAIQQHFSTPIAPMVIPAWLSLSSTVLVLLICLISSLLPYLRVRKVDPLLVLQN